MDKDTRKLMFFFTYVHVVGAWHLVLVVDGLNSAHMLLLRHPFCLKILLIVFSRHLLILLIHVLIYSILI